MPADTGNGATIALSTTGAVGNIRNIGEIATELGKLEVSHLGTLVNKEYIPDDLEEPGQVELEVEFDGTKSLPARGVVETATITYPQPDGFYSPVHAGTGFITKVSTPQLANGSVQISKITFAFDGKTGPTFTAGVSTTTTTTTTTT